MESCNTLNIGSEMYHKIESPLAAFNNFMIDLGEELKELFDEDLFESNNVLFDDENICLFGFIKILRRNKSEIDLKITGLVNKKRSEKLKIVLDNFNTITGIFYKYLFILNDVRSNYDDSISSKYVEKIYEDIIKLDNEKLSNKIYLVPYQNKIFRNYDGTNKNIDPSLDSLLKRYTYVINFLKLGYKKYQWNLIKIFSTDLNESYSIENIRPLDKEYLQQGEVSGDDLYQFLIKLMYYGEF